MGGVEQVRGPKKQISRQMHMFQPKGLLYHSKLLFFRSDLVIYSFTFSIFSGLKSYNKNRLVLSGPPWTCIQNY
jgi:hypothetical protein